MNIIITGASRGIGYETAKLLSKEHSVITVSRDAVKNHPSEVLPIAFDLEKGNIKKDLLPKVKNCFDNVDVLINNAGAFIKKPFEEITRKDLEKIFRINVLPLQNLHKPFFR